MSSIYAKSKPPETLETHTNSLLKAFDCLADIYSKEGFFNKHENYIKKILYYHDQGKANIPFQNLIRRNMKQPPLGETSFDMVIPHEIFSLSFITEEDEQFFDSLDNDTDNISFYDLACYCIAFHHSRNKNYPSKAIEGQLKEIRNNKSLLDIKGDISSISDIQGIKQKIEATANWPLYWEFVSLFKGILHKCDYAASAHIDPEIPFKGDYSKMFTRGLQNRHIEKLKDFQEQAAEHRDKNVILIAPTGAGKTEYSMNWINGCKAFYLLGLKTAVNAMYDRFEKMFAFDKEHKDNVGLLHGESIYRLIEASGSGDGDDETESNFSARQTKARNLSHPIIVATADQLVPSVFKFPGFEFYYFTASYSKIVVDEIQSFSPEAIASIVVFLKEVERLGGKFLLMTATLPPFVLKEFEKDTNLKGELTVLKLKELKLPEKRRHVISLSEEHLQSDESKAVIEKAIKENKKVLVVANTVSCAQEFFDAFVEWEPKLLHSRFIRKDRSEKEEQIKRESDYEIHPENKNKPCLWISTQIVEASLDIDFDILLTENATVDALFQRFGRVWRKREYEETEPNIFIFRPADEKINDFIYDPEISSRTWQELCRYKGMHIGEQDKQDVIGSVFSDIDGTEYKKNFESYKELLKLGLRAQNKDKAHALFRKVNNSYTVIPKPVYDENEEEINRLFECIADKNNSFEERMKGKREIMDFTAPVQIFKGKSDMLKYFYLSNGKKFEDADVRLLLGAEYSQEKGIEFIKDYKDESNFID